MLTEINTPVFYGMIVIALLLIIISIYVIVKDNDRQGFIMIGLVMIVSMIVSNYTSTNKTISYYSPETLTIIYHPDEAIITDFNIKVTDVKSYNKLKSNDYQLIITKHYNFLEKCIKTFYIIE